MFLFLHNLLGIPQQSDIPELPDESEPDKPSKHREYDNIFTTNLSALTEEKRKQIINNAFLVTPADFQMEKSYTFDSTDSEQSAKSLFVIGEQRIPEKLFAWFVMNGFIGYQACSFLAQHWLINRCCSMKGRDAIRNWFELEFDEGVKVGPEVTAAINKQDRRYKLKQMLEKADKFKNVFGISHILFLVDSDDDEYYQKPFNPDGIAPGRYKGMVHIDPYWVTPLLATEDVESPESQGFYDPTYWVISGVKYHHSHMIILRGSELSDILKPSYLYGGLPLTQLIFERVYAAERTANEAPQLAMTKRLVIRYLEDIEQINTNPKFEEETLCLSEFRDNFGVLLDSIDNKIEQQDTSLADLDSVIMTQYQIVAAEAGIPATKLLGTSPKGFQSTGDHEIRTYHEELETIQENDLTPIVNKHHVCLMRSKIAPKYLSGDPVEVDITWRPLAVLSEKEIAEANEAKSRTLSNYKNTGSIDQYDIRDYIISDERLGLTGIESIERPEELEELPDTDPDMGEVKTSLFDESETNDDTEDEPDQDQAQEEYPNETGDILRKERRQWFIYSESGEKLEGPFSRKYRALERLKQIEKAKKAGDGENG